MIGNNGRQLNAIFFADKTKTNKSFKSIYFRLIEYYDLFFRIRFLNSNDLQKGLIPLVLLKKMQFEVDIHIA